MNAGTTSALVVTRFIESTDWAEANKAWPPNDEVLRRSSQVDEPRSNAFSPMVPVQLSNLGIRRASHGPNSGRTAEADAGSRISDSGASARRRGAWGNCL